MSNSFGKKFHFFFSLLDDRSFCRFIFMENLRNFASVGNQFSPRRVNRAVIKKTWILIYLSIDIIRWLIFVVFFLRVEREMSPGMWRNGGGTHDYYYVMHNLHTIFVFFWPFATWIRNVFHLPCLFFISFFLSWLVLSSFLFWKEENILRWRADDDV